MNKERPQRKHDTTPCPYRCKADRPFKGLSKGEGQCSSTQKVKKDKHEYLASQCADTPKTLFPVNTQDSVLQTETYSDNQKKKNLSAEKRRKKHNSENKVQDLNLKLLTNHLLTDPYFTYCLYVANELRKYDFQTLACCKKKFSEVLFDADTWTLLKRYHPRSSAPLRIFPNYLLKDPYFAYSQYIVNELGKYDLETLACVKKAISEVLFEADNCTLLNSCHSRNLKYCASVKQENEQYAHPDTPPTTSSFNKVDFQKTEVEKDFIPLAVETSNNPFQSTDEEVDSDWEDILPESSTNCEENDSSVENIDSSSEIAEDSSPEIMRFEGRNFSEEIISPLEYPRQTIESDLNFSPKLASTQVEFSLGNSRIFDRRVHQSTKTGISLENKDVTANGPDISNFLEDRQDADIEDENSLPSTIIVPNFLNFDEVDVEGETSFITTTKTADIVDTVFKHPDEPNSTNLHEAVIASGTDEQHSQVESERRSLNEPLINDAPQTGNTRRFFSGDASNYWFSKGRPTKGKGRAKIDPKQLFIHSNLSSRELNNSINQSTGKFKGIRTKQSTRILPPNPPKATNCCGRSTQDEYSLRNDESDIDPGIYIPIKRRSTVAGNLEQRKKTPGVKSPIKNKKQTSYRSSVACKPLSE